MQPVAVMVAVLFLLSVYNVFVSSQISMNARVDHVRMGERVLMALMDIPVFVFLGILTIFALRVSLFLCLRNP